MSESDEREPYEATREEVAPGPERPDHEAHEPWAWPGDEEVPESQLPRLSARGGRG